MKFIPSERPRLRRRDLLRIGPVSMVAWGLSDLLAAEATATPNVHHDAPARNVIMLWLAGGPSTIDMWDLKPADARARGEFRPISTSADYIQICEHLPKMARVMQECTLVRSLTHTIAEHDQGTQYVLTGNPLSPALKYPSIGSIVSKQISKSAHLHVPAYVDLSGMEIGKAGYLGSSHNPFVVDKFMGMNRRAAGEGSSQDQFDLPPGMTVADLDRRSELLSDLETGFRPFDRDERAAEMRHFQRQATGILSTGRARDALDLSRESVKSREEYGAGLGQNALAARRLIEAGSRFVLIAMPGWDTHSNNFRQLREQLLPQLDTALSTLLKDLKSRGLLDETIVYCVGEFNRTPTINSQAGRDHWARAMSVLVAGGGFKRGFVYGSTDNSGSEPDSHPCSPADINATVLNQLGIAPDTKLTTRSGRPLHLFRDGNVLSALV